MSNVFTVCENCKAQFPHRLLAKCESCGSEQVYQDTEVCIDEEFDEINLDLEDFKLVTFY